MKHFTLFSLLLLMMGGLAVSRHPNSTSQTAHHVFPIYYSHDRRGAIGSCGCRLSPAGKMAREARYLDRNGAAHAVRLAGGDTFFAKGVSPFSPRAKLIVQAMNAFGIDAIAPGVADFAVGLRALQSLACDAKFPFVVTNAEPAIFPRFADIERDGKRIRVYAVLPEGEAGGVQFTAIDEALESALAAEGSKPWLRVLIAPLSESRAHELAVRYPELSIILGAAVSNGVEFWNEGRNLAATSQPDGASFVLAGLEPRPAISSFFDERSRLSAEAELRFWRAQPDTPSVASRVARLEKMAGTPSPNRLRVNVKNVSPGIDYDDMDSPLAQIEKKAERLEP